MSNLEYACKIFGWAGGNIHQVAEFLNVPADNLISMEIEEFSNLLITCINKLAKFKKCNFGNWVYYYDIHRVFRKPGHADNEPSDGKFLHLFEAFLNQKSNFKVDDIRKLAIKNDTDTGRSFYILSSNHNIDCEFLKDAIGDKTIMFAYKLVKYENQTYIGLSQGNSQYIIAQARLS